MKKSLSLLLALALAVSALTACGGGSGSGSTTAAAAPAETKAAETQSATLPDIGKVETAAAGAEVAAEASGKGAAETSSKDSLIMGYTKEPDSISPGTDSKTNAQMVCQMCYDALVGKDPENQSVMVPGIASSWDFEDDGTTLVFHIRDDIKFHDGTPLTVEDVLFSLDYAVQQGLNAAGASILKSWEAGDDNTVIVHLEYAYKPILQILAMPGFSIINKAFYEKCEAEGTNFGQVENGTGAYILERWTQGDRIVLKAYDDWHRGTPAIKHVEIVTIPDETSGALMAENHEIDFFIGMNSADVDRMMKVDGLEILNVVSAGTHLAAMNLTREPFKDNLALREAVAYAMNRDEILEGGMNGYGKVTPGPVTPGYFGYVEDFEPYPYDPEKAKEKLAEAGYPDGLHIVFKTPSDSWYCNPSQVLCEQLRKVGFDVEIQIQERATYLQECQNNLDYDMCWYMTWGDFPDADPPMWTKFHSSCIGQNMGNWGGLNDPEVDALLLKARTSIDDEERIACYKELAELNKENCWYLFVFTSYNPICFDSHLKGVVPITSVLYNPAFFYWE